MNVVAPGSYLAANVQALAHVAPTLAERITWPVNGDHVGIGEDGAWHYRWHQRWLPLQLDDQARGQALTPGLAQPRVAVLGLGDPHLVLALLQQNSGVVYAWDRDPWLMRLFLGTADLVEPLRAGRLRLLMGVDLISERAALATSSLVVHPVLGQLYENERKLITSPMNQLAFVAKGGLFVDDLAHSLWNRGFSVFIIDLHAVATDEVAFAVQTARPRLLAAVNYTEGLAEFCEQCQLPLLCWEVDPSTSALPPCQTATSQTFVFTYREAHVDLFKRAGFEHVEYLPLAANPQRRAPLTMDAAEQQNWGAGRPTFVGSSIGLEIPRFRAAFDAVVARHLASEDPHPPQATAWLEHALAAQRRSPNQLVVAAALEQVCPGLSTAASGTAVQAAAEIAASEKRLRYMAALGPMGMWVWGDEGWRLMDAVAPGHQASYRGQAGHMVDITKIYNASAVNVDVGRVYQADIVTMRVFDIAACGGFLLAEWSPALDQAFRVGEDIECHRSFDELAEKTQHYLRNPVAAQKIATRTRAAVLGSHTIDQRVAHMLGRAGL
ncbi:MAG: glycosyltransferase [Deltaproteobacteria bacterium]|nr:glycosyltransferase [Deltaproteobacteria bacterium]